MKKLSAILICALMVVALFAGCGGSKEKTSDGKIIVRFMVGGSAEELAQYTAAVEAFNAQSADTFVDLVGLPGEGYNEKVLTQLASKTPPDCFYSEEATFGELNNSDKLLDLGAYLDKGEFGLSRDKIPASLLEFNTQNGKLTGIPVDSNPMVIYYNVELFESLGIQSPQDYVDAGEWNYAALQKTSEQLRNAGHIGFVFEKWWGPLYSFLLSKGDSVYSEDGKSTNFGNPRMLAGLTYLENNLKSKAFVYTGDSSSLASGESPDTLFMTGKTGFIYAGRWFVPDFKEIEFQWDVVPFPGFEKQADVISPMPATPLVINKAAKHPDNTWQFVSFYCGTQGQEIRMKDAGNAVPTIPGLDSIVLTGTPPHAQYFLDAVQVSFTYPRVEALHPGLTDKLTDELEKMLVGQQDAATTIAGFQTIADAEIAK